MDSAKQQLIEKLKSANNVLVTVSRNPSVDQLSALLGLSLIMNKQGKHSAAVFSGQIPSTLEFLKPEDTIEKTTDSLRDFIIALDKNKADKLRYKVEDNIVRIFITPYRTKISQGDLEFSQGDFNVDIVVALGVKNQEELDEAITSHGRILHDATVSCINTDSQAGDIGSINWSVSGASSLCELVAELAESLGDNILDEQIATALLTGIVAETNRFSNDKTSSQTMNISGVLMSAGANQQLIATKLEEKPKAEKVETQVSDLAQSPEVGEEHDGVLQIDHADSPDSKSDESIDDELPTPQDTETVIPETLSENKVEPIMPSEPVRGLSGGPKLVTEAPTMGGTLTANSTQNEDSEPTTDPFSMPQTEQPQIFERKNTVVPDLTPLSDQTLPPTPPPSPAPIEPINKVATPATFTPPPANWQPPASKPTAEPKVEEKPEEDKKLVPELRIDEDGTLSQLEESVHSPHLNQDSQDSTDAARDEVDKALSTVNSSAPKPVEALNSQPLGPELHPETNQIEEINLDKKDENNGSNGPPPVPPPIMFPTSS